MDAVSSSLTVGRSRTSAGAWLAANANVPNVITALRALMLPVIADMYFRQNWVWALALSIASAVTDIIDGFVARWLNQCTPFGKWFDSIVDKASNLTQMLLILSLPAVAFAGLMPMRIVFGFVIAMELILAFSRIERVKSKFGFIKNDSAQWPGKAKAWMQNLAIGFFLLGFVYVSDKVFFSRNLGRVEIFFYAAAIFTLLSVLYRLDKRVWRIRFACWWLKYGFHI